MFTKFLKISLFAVVISILALGTAFGWLLSSIMNFILWLVGKPFSFDDLPALGFIKKKKPEISSQKEILVSES